MATGPLPARPSDAPDDAPVGAPAVRRVREVDPRREPRWAEFVDRHPDALPYHDPAWLTVIEEAYGHPTSGLLCEDPDGTVRGVLPLARTRGLLTGRRLASLPHTPRAGPLGDPDAAVALVRAAVERVDAAGGERLQIKTALPDLHLAVPGLVRLPWEPTYVLGLPERPEQVRFGNSRNHTRIKGKVTSAERRGLTIRVADSDADLRRWYRLYLETIRRHAVPPRPLRFFRAAWRALAERDRLRLLLAEAPVAGRRRLVAGSLFLIGGRTVVYAKNGVDRRFLSLHPNDALQWRAIHDAVRSGFRRYDFGEVDEHNEGLAAFKAKWGAEAVPLYRYAYPAPRELEAGILRPASPARRAAQAVWRRLPLTATAVLGDWLYRHG